MTGLNLIIGTTGKRQCGKRKKKEEEGKKEENRREQCTRRGLTIPAATSSSWLTKRAGSEKHSELLCQPLG